MTLQVRLVYHHRGCITESFTDGDFASRISSDRVSDLILIQTPTPDRLSEIMAELRRYSKGPLEIIGERPTAALVRMRNPPDDFLDSVLRTGCHVVLPAVYTGGKEHHQILAPDEAAVARLTECLQRHGTIVSKVVDDVQIEQFAPAVRLPDLVGDLTPKQLDILLSAVHAGYYDTPRRITAGGLAELRGIGRTTIDEHLRKAERHLTSRLAKILGAYPFPTRIAQRTVGRPARRAGRDG